MMNEYLWKLYLSSGGDKTVSFFKKELSINISNNYIEKISELQSEYCVATYIKNELKNQLEFVIKEIKKSNYDKEPELLCHYKNDQDLSDDIDDFLADHWKDSLEECKGNEKNCFSGEVGWFEAYTTFLAIDYPGVFIPYYFKCNFNVFKNIADTFGIELPAVPNKKDYAERFYYYGEICKALYRFREANNWTIYELYAFLYDFAPKYIGGKDSYIEKKLPKPRSAFFIGGNGTGPDSKAEDDKDSVIFFQCNPDVRAGDMVVMYQRSPVSAITSVWRSCCAGFIDPFFFYYRCTYIWKPEKIKRISNSKISKDKILGEMPVVRKNLQGINGVELKPSEYNHILDVAGDKKIERLPSAVRIGSGDCINEKAVEDEKIKPFLKKIGYEETDYEQQIKIPIGNNRELLIPDFILLPENKRGFKTGFAIIEAKRSITDEKSLKKTIVQARSYAVQLRVKYSVIASQEGIWIMSDRGDYAEVENHYDWKDLRKGDSFNELLKILGK